MKSPAKVGAEHCYYRMRTDHGYIAVGGFLDVFPWHPKSAYVGHYITRYRSSWDGAFREVAVPVVATPTGALTFPSEDEEALAFVRQFAPEAHYVPVTARKRAKRTSAPDGA